MNITNSTVPVYAGTGTATTVSGCSECPDDYTVERARQMLLRTIIKYGDVPGPTANDVRNWATAYGILTDKLFLEQSHSGKTAS